MKKCISKKKSSNILCLQLSNNSIKGGQVVPARKRMNNNIQWADKQEDKQQHWRRGQITTSSRRRNGNLEQGDEQEYGHEHQAGMAPQVVRNNKAKQKNQERKWTKKEDKEHEKTTMQMRL